MGDRPYIEWGSQLTPCQGDLTEQPWEVRLDSRERNRGYRVTRRKRVTWHFKSRRPTVSLREHSRNFHTRTEQVGTEGSRIRSWASYHSKVIYRPLILLSIVTSRYKEEFTNTKKNINIQTQRRTRSVERSTLFLWRILWFSISSNNRFELYLPTVAFEPPLD